MTTLFINDEHCFNINQLKQYFELPIKYGSPLFKDILDYGRAGDIAKWLREHNECELADGVDLIADDIGDGEYMSCISDIITGKKVSSSKPEFSKLFNVQDIKVDELGNETVVCVSLKVMRVINESYFLMIRSSWGTRAMNINPLDFKQGIVTKQEFHFRKRPTPITKIELYADGIKLKIFEDTLTFQVEDSTFKMIFVERGELEVGGGIKKHKITLIQDFYIGEVPVTQKLWIAIMGSNPSCFRTSLNNPVESVSWGECHVFVKKLNKKLSQVLSGRKFRLPREKEWEFAALGGNSSMHFRYSGSDDCDEVGWFKSNSLDTTHEVAKLKPNELGLFDMSGNVSEWCDDYYGHYGNYVAKGGSFCSNGCWITSRDTCAHSSYNFGVRLCLS